MKDITFLYLQIGDPWFLCESDYKIDLFSGHQ